MRQFAAIVVVLAATGLCACGQKGPLVRPGKHGPDKPVSQPANAAPATAPGAAPESAPAAPAASAAH